jgi:hypothetical protein
MGELPTHISRCHTGTFSLIFRTFTAGGDWGGLLTDQTIIARNLDPLTSQLVAPNAAAIQHYLGSHTWRITVLDMREFGGYESTCVIPVY